MVDSYEDIDSGLLTVLYVDRVDSLLILLQAWESLLRVSPLAYWSKVELCYGGHQFSDRVSPGCRQTEVDRPVCDDLLAHRGNVYCMVCSRLQLVPPHEVLSDQRQVSP